MSLDLRGEHHGTHWPWQEKVTRIGNEQVLGTTGIEGRPWPVNMNHDLFGFFAREQSAIVHSNRAHDERVCSGRASRS